MSRGAAALLGFDRRGQVEGRRQGRTSRGSRRARRGTKRASMSFASSLSTTTTRAQRRHRPRRRRVVAWQTSARHRRETVRHRGRDRRHSVNHHKKKTRTREKMSRVRTRASASVGWSPSFEPAARRPSALLTQTPRLRGEFARRPRRDDQRVAEGPFRSRSAASPRPAVLNNATARAL